MAFQDLRKSRDTGATSTSTSTSAGGVGALTAFIDQGSEFSGKLSFKDTVRIDGKFEGEIASENTLIVGESGSVTAQIKSQIVVVSGEVRGDIQAAERITLHKTARVHGDLHTKSLVVEDGAHLDGRIDMSSNAGGKTATLKPAGSPNPNANGKGQDKPQS